MIECKYVLKVTSVETLLKVDLKKEKLIGKRDMLL